MGYDDGECLPCYCQGGGNNLLDEKEGKISVCLSCIDKMCGDGSTPRVLGVLQHSDWDTNGTCRCCEKENVITIKVSVCSYHQDDYTDDSCDICGDQNSIKIVNLCHDCQCKTGVLKENDSEEDL